MAIKQGDFIEIEFVGKTQDNEIFDTNIKEEAEKIGRKSQEASIDNEQDSYARKTIICIGEGMLLKAIDEFLIGKELGKHNLSLSPEKAFGLRKKELIKIMPMSVFKNSQYKPQVGMLFTFDNLIGKINAMSGGRVVVDFNNPMAGKNVFYELNTKSEIKDENEKVKALMRYFLRKEFEFKIENNKLIIEAEKDYAGFIPLFKDTFKKILNLELEIKEKP